MNQAEFDQKKELFVDYLKNEKRLSENTIRVYNSDLLQIKELWLKLEKEEQKEILFESILERFSTHLFNNIDLSSIARKFSCINTFKKFLTKKIGFPVQENLKRPYVCPKVPVILNKKEICYLMDSAIENDIPTKYPLRDKAIIELLYATGLRCAELVQIELNNIDFSNQLIIIRNKNKKERFVIFGSKACERIKDYLQNERIAPQSPYEKLFLNYKNTPITTRSIQRVCAMFRQCLETKQNITPYVLRHSFATHMLSNGANLETIQDLLGHKTRSSTQRYMELITGVTPQKKSK